MAAHATEVSKGERFEFGANWGEFLTMLNEECIALPEQWLFNMLCVSNRKRFLDTGSGSWLFSLMAWRLGAMVHSFDFYRKQGFSLVRLKTCPGWLGCNEFVFVNKAVEE